MYQTETDGSASCLISLTGVLVVFLPDVLFYLKDAANCSKIAILSAYQVCNYGFLFQIFPYKIGKGIEKSSEILKPHMRSYCDFIFLRWRSS